MSGKEERNLREEQPEKKNYWIYATVILGLIVTLLLLGEKTPKFNLGWVALILALYFFYLGYHYYILRLKTPSFPEMIKIIKAEEVKRGLYLDDSPINVYGEPLGADLFGIRFLDICTTYIIFRNICCFL